MSIAMNKVESYVFNFSGDKFDQSPTKLSSVLVVDPEVGSWVSPSVTSSSSSSATSSIGRNSDDEDAGKSSEDGGEDAGENEAESPYKGPIDLMESLEDFLPVRKGISKFYNGKSKSFMSLVEVDASPLTSSSSMKDLAKPENPYSRRRRNLLCHQIWENNKTTPRGGISKKHIMSSSRSAMTLAMAVAAGVTNGGGGEGSSSGGDSSSSGSSPTTSGSPPRQRHHRQTLPPMYPKSQGSFSNLTSSPSLDFFALRSDPATAGDC